MKTIGLIPCLKSFKKANLKMNIPQVIPMAKPIVSIFNNSEIFIKYPNKRKKRERIKKAIEERTLIIKNEMPKMLWD